MRNHKEYETLVLLVWQRIVALVIGILFLIATAWYGLHDRLIFVAASGCTDAPVGCAVQVSSEPNAAVLITLVVIAAVWLLIGVGGRVPGFDVGGFGMHLPGTTAAAGFVSMSELPVDSKLREHGDAHISAASPGGRNSRNLYMSLPLDVRLAADNTWSSTFPRSLLSEACQEVRPERVESCEVWFIKALSPLGEELWLRVIRP